MNNAIDTSLAILRNRCFVREKDVLLIANQLKKIGMKSLKEYKKSDVWKRTSKLLIAEYNSCCQMCGSRDRLSSHHRNYFNVGEEKPGDIVPLCFICHFAKGSHRIHKTLHSFHFFTPSKSTMAAR